MNCKNKIFKLSFVVFFLSVSFFFNNSASAISQVTCICGDQKNISADNCDSCVSLCSANGGTGECKKASVQTDVSAQSLPNPLGITDVNAFIAQLINFVLSLVGSISLLLFVYGGITWMTSAGAPAAVKKGKDIVVWAVIGLAVVFTSYILVKFVIQGITGA